MLCEKSTDCVIESRSPEKAYVESFGIQRVGWITLTANPSTARFTSIVKKSETSAVAIPVTQAIKDIVDLFKTSSCIAHTWYIENLVNYSEASQRKRIIFIRFTTTI